MIRVDAYRCSHCGKLFLTERRCVKHEEKYCNKSPCNIAACIFLSQTRCVEEACKFVSQLNRKIKRIYATPIVYYMHYG